MLAALSLTTPLMLWGLGLLALPVIAHLLHRHSRRRIYFPSIRLLEACVASQSKLFKLRRWILLALRAAMVALVVAAFARPLWLAARTPAEGSGNNVALVLLVDVSASTRQETSGVALVDAFRGAAARALEELTSSDSAGVVYASGEPTVLFPRLTSNLPGIRAELAKLEATADRADLPKAIALAGQLLGKHSGPRRLVVLSDLEQTNWQEVVADHKVAALLPQGTRITIVDPAAGAVDNIALSAARSSPAQPLAGQSVQLAVHVANFSPRDKQVPVDALLDGKALERQTVTLAPGEARDVLFSSVLETAGQHRVEFLTAADGLRIDDRAFLVTDAATRLPIVIVSDDDPNEPGTGSYFLGRALAPHGDQSDRYEVEYVKPANLPATNLSNAAAVLVGYLGELPAESAAALTAYVRGGGGLVFFCGEGSVERHLTVLDGPPDQGGILPWLPGAQRPPALRNDALHVTSGKWRSRLLSDFDEQSQIAFARIRFERVWTTGPVRPEAQVLLTYADGTPAMASRPLGSGELLVANFSPSLQSSDLGKYGAFVALVQVIAKSLRPRHGSPGDALVGMPYQFPSNIAATEEGAPPVVRGPGEAIVPAVMNLADGKLNVQLARPQSPGFYLVQSAGKTLAAAAINVDPRESDLRRVDRAELSGRLENAGMRIESVAAGDWEPLGNLRGRPLWGSLLVAAMVVVGIELFLLGLWRR